MKVCRVKLCAHSCNSCSCTRPVCEDAFIVHLSLVLCLAAHDLGQIQSEKIAIANKPSEIASRRCIGNEMNRALGHLCAHIG